MPAQGDYTNGSMLYREDQYLDKILLCQSHSITDESRRSSKPHAVEVPVSSTVACCRRIQCSADQPSDDAPRGGHFTVGTSPVTGSTIVGNTGSVRPRRQRRDHGIGSVRPIVPLADVAWEWLRPDLAIEDVCCRRQRQPDS